jgi:hypothetical protein
MSSQLGQENKVTIHNKDSIFENILSVCTLKEKGKQITLLPLQGLQMVSSFPMKKMSY